MNRASIFVLAVGALALAQSARAYPGGTPTFVADIAPNCAGCHASVSVDQFTGVPEARANAELVANKHYAKIQTPAQDSPYAKLSAQQREALLDGIKKIDAATSVKLVAPASAKAGELIDVSVEVTGGGAPVLGVALVDTNQRWQASPATSAGWQVTAKPIVTGPDGKPQTKFTDGRNPVLRPGTTYVNVDGISADPGAGKYSTVKVAWKLRAPAQGGKTPLVAVLLYGTEVSSPHGAVETPYGKQPVGTYLGNSGRVKFSDVVAVDVK
jgi:hypothetical protein